MEFSCGAIEPFLRSRIKCPGQSKLSSVRDLKRMIKITRLCYSENRSKYFLLLDRRARLDIVYDRRFDIESNRIITFAAGQHFAALVNTLLDVVKGRVV